ncbi:MAG: hypothetical protein FJ091_18965 [Deltaproteobacteria bacterium]|nr:hypothetical protein [Deltaproteobacteria bacterium]
MNRLNHVKIVSTDPEAVDRFLRLVAEVPAGWPLGDQGKRAPSPPSPSLAIATLTNDEVFKFRGASETNGFIVGDEKSRQFQILRGNASRIWGLAIGTRDVARAHRLCLEHGFEASPIEVTPWSPGQQVRFFFAKAGGVMFEVMSVERSGS